MKKLRLLLLVVFAPMAGASSEKEFHEAQAQIAKGIAALALSDGHLFLYSLNPAGGIGYSVNNDTVFHGFKILGEVEVTGLNEKRALIEAFAKGVRDDGGMVAACFNPRHGIRFVADSSQYDFVICFECGSVMTYGFNGGRGFLVNGSPSREFNDFIAKYHLKTLTKDHEADASNVPRY